MGHLTSTVLPQTSQTKMPDCSDKLPARQTLHRFPSMVYGEHRKNIDLKFGMILVMRSLRYLKNFQLKVNFVDIDRQHSRQKGCPPSLPLFSPIKLRGRVVFVSKFSQHPDIQIKATKFNWQRLYC